MHYSKKLDDLLDEYDEALDNARDNFGMGEWCGTVVCACGHMAINRLVPGFFGLHKDQVTDGAERISREISVAAGDILFSGDGFIKRYSATNQFNAIPMRLTDVLYSSVRDTKLVDKVPVKKSREEQLAAQKEVSAWFRRRNRALWAHEKRMSLPRRERRDFDISEKNLRDAA